jgi:hypothetical protein
MAAEKKLRHGTHVREISLAVEDVNFDEIVEILRRVWTVPELPGIKGCDPCRSGLDRFVIEDPAFRMSVGP